MGQFFSGCTIGNVQQTYICCTFSTVHSEKNWLKYTVTFNIDGYIPQKVVNASCDNQNSEQTRIKAKESTGIWETSLCVIPLSVYL